MSNGEDETFELSGLKYCEKKNKGIYNQMGKGREVLVGSIFVREKPIRVKIIHLSISLNIYQYISISIKSRGLKRS